MHSQGVPQIGIESAVSLRQPHCHAAVDAAVNILPRSMVEQWLTRDTYCIFLRTLSKIAYRRLEKKLAPEPNST